MRSLVPLLALLGLAILFATTYRARAARLRRLEQLVRPVDAALSPGQPLQQRILRFLPRQVIRNLRLLGIEPDLRGVAAAAGVLIAALTMALLLLGPAVAVGLAVACAAAGLVALNLLAARRLADLAALTPGFFDRVRQLLIVGNTLPTAFSRAVQGAQPRLARAFAPALRRMGNGASFAESIRQNAEEIDLYEVRLFATAVAANMRFGGSLTHSLGNLVSYLRKRASIERELRANTAQIRASAWVLGLLPALVASLIVIQNPDYARWFVAHPTGRVMLVYCVLSQLVGLFAMRAIVRTAY
jgi:tight adherence protein B